jgi:alpha-glucosidase
MKDVDFRDNPPNPDYRPGEPSVRRVLELHSADQPEIFEVIAEMRRVVDAFPGRVLIGEIYLPLERLVAYYGTGGSGVQLPFNFHLILARWTATDVAEIVREYERLVPPGEWPNWVLGNHDQRRIASRIGLAQARVAAMLLLSLRGTPTLYYGDEIGMEDVPIPVDSARDSWTRTEPGIGAGRDPQRTPLQWNASPNAGFSSGTPWLPLHPKYVDCNVDTLSRDPHSLLSLYRQLIRLRRARPALIGGTQELVPAPDDVLAYRRTHGTDLVLVVLNFGKCERTLQVRGEVLLSTHLDRVAERIGGELSLRPNEGVVMALSESQDAP